MGWDRVVLIRAGEDRMGWVEMRGMGEDRIGWDVGLEREA